MDKARQKTLREIKILLFKKKFIRWSNSENQITILIIFWGTIIIRLGSAEER